MFRFMHFPKRVLVVPFFFSFPPTDWNLNSQFKMALSIPHYFEKLLLSLNFNCFQAHSFPLVVLVHTVHWVTVGRRGQHRKYLTGLAGDFMRWLLCVMARLKRKRHSLAERTKVMQPLISNCSKIHCNVLQQHFIHEILVESQKTAVVQPLFCHWRAEIL